jgi:predicted RNA-binding protein
MIFVESHAPSKESKFRSKIVVDGDKKETQTKVEKIDALENRYSLKEIEGSFIIARPTEDDGGVYVCSLLGESKTITVPGKIDQLINRLHRFIVSLF